MAPTVDTTHEVSEPVFLSPVKSPQGFAFEVPVKSPLGNKAARVSRWGLLSARLERQKATPLTPPKAQRPSDDMPVLLSIMRAERARDLNKQKREAAERAGEKQAEHVRKLAVDLAARFEHAAALQGVTLKERGARAGDHNKAVSKKVMKHQEACLQRKEELLAKIRAKGAKAMASPMSTTWRYKPSVGTWLLKPSM